MNNNELELWFNNALKMIENDKILFINNVSIKSMDSIRKRYLDNADITRTFKINFLDNTNYGINFSISVNSLVYLKNDEKFANNDILKKNIIYVSDDSFLLNFERLIFGITSTIELKQFTYIELKKIDIEDILKDNKNILLVIRERENILQNILGENYLNKMKYNGEVKDQELIDDINILKEKRILVTKFAHYLYRIFMLDFNSSVTKVGLNIRKSLNVKSKTFTYKYLTDKRRDNCNLKAYDLNINQIEFDTKIKIAKKLLSLKKEKLDYKTIAKITELSEKDVLKLFKNVGFLNF